MLRALPGQMSKLPASPLELRALHRWKCLSWSWGHYIKAPMDASGDRRNCGSSFCRSEDQGCTCENAEQAAAEHGIRLEVVRLPGTKRGFVLLPRRWVVERSFAWLSRFRQPARDYER